MFKTIASVIVATFFVAALSFNAYAEKPHHDREYRWGHYDSGHSSTDTYNGHHKSKRHSIKSLIQHRDYFELTDEQVSTLKNLKRNYKKESIRLNADIDIAEIDLKAALHAPNPDRNNVNSLIEQMGSLKISLKKAKTNSLLDAFGLLTDEQMKKMRSRKKHHGSKHNDKDGYSEKHHGNRHHDKD